MPYDVAEVRRYFPALLEGAAHFDGPGGSQVPTPVAAAVAGTLSSAVANRGRITRAERRADDIVHGARLAVADLLDGDPGGVVFGRSMTQLTFDVSRTLARTWRPGDEIVVTRLDHDANIRPWVQAARGAGAGVRWAEFDPRTGELPLDAVTELLTPNTRLVAVTGASNLLGTRPDVPAIAGAAHRVGALVYVDAVHLAPHAPVSRAELGADFVVCSPYKFFGPHLGALAADPALLETLRPDKLLSSTDEVPERFELGTLPYELLAGTTAAIDFIAGLGGMDDEPSDRRGYPQPRIHAATGRRSRLIDAMRVVEEYEGELFARVLAGLEQIPGVRMHGGPLRRTPTVLFSVDGLAPAYVHQQLAAVGVNAPAGSFYALEASRRLGLGDDGAVRVGLAPYTDASDVDRLLDALDRLVASGRSLPGAVRNQP